MLGLVVAVFISMVICEESSSVTGLQRTWIASTPAELILFLQDSQQPPSSPPSLAPLTKLYWFFDLDETLVCRETCINYESPDISSILQTLLTQCCQGPTADSCNQAVLDHMEQRYYTSNMVLTDVALTAFLASTLQFNFNGNNSSPHFHQPFIHAITSNRRLVPTDNIDQSSLFAVKHVNSLINLLTTISKQRGYQRWFHDLHLTSSGTLPLSNAILENIPLVGGVIFRGKAQEKEVNLDGTSKTLALDKNKGAIILEYLSFLHNVSSIETNSEKYVVLLVDDTLDKLHAALDYFQRYTASSLVCILPYQNLTIQAALAQYCQESKVVFIPLWFTHITLRGNTGKLCAQLEMKEIVHSINSSNNSLVTDDQRTCLVKTLATIT